ncbi:uncharacterized protein [Periplaneta americana]|uniref:uncharacterized protein n=1 Tax=Periplaneta americana TaxID=6978 RepID=UPI0037E89163
MKDEHLERAMVAVLKKLGFDPKTQYRMETYIEKVWISCISRIVVEEQGDEGAVTLFVKTLPDLKRQEFFGSRLCFSNEISLYTKVFTVFSDFQREKGIAEPIQFVPRCYFAECDGVNDILILEDLSPQGFSVPSYKQPLGLQNLRLLMQTLGKFHALSLAIKSVQPQRFRDIRAAVMEVMWISEVTEGSANKYFNKIGSDIFELLVQEEGPDSEYALKLRDFTAHVPQNMQQLTQTDPSNEPWNVITHGDLWASNLLYRQLPGSTELRFIDLQHSRYGSPALDLSSVLFLSMDGPMRAEHGDTLLQLYHSTLCQFLTHLGVDPEQVFPFCKVEEQLKKFGRFGVGVSLFNLPHALYKGSQQKSLEFDEIITVMEKEQNNLSPECRQRILDNLRDCVDRGYVA